MTRAKTPRCKSCRWWDRSNNYRAMDRDWGICHFWGGRHVGARIHGGFIDMTVGHEPRGSNTCDWHDADPSLRGTVPAVLAPPLLTEGDTP